MDERVVSLLKDARRQLEAERLRRTEPIAIVGIGCRLPGGSSSPEALWRLLRDGVDATSDVPADRWDAEALYDADPDAPGKAYVKRGGFLERIDAFDPEFFGISPREALGMDPQQRLLLEVVWEALEDAGIPPERLRGTATGVWVGLCMDDYARRSVTSGDLTLIDAYSALGNTRSVAAGRISYVFDLRGPAVQLDTACSSSLVAIHQACQSLRAGECDLGLVGGVNLMSAPEATVALCKLHALARDGRCKAFDAAADGYARGEGCGIVVLKRLADARAAGDRIHAVVRGSAVNHDGRSNGLTAPNGFSQEAVIRAALTNASVEPADVGYVEAHGTGTLLGDPIEVMALGRVYANHRAADASLYLGTVKTNFGHLEAAAGVAGLIKLALCLSRGQIAPNLHFVEPNPRIPWSDLGVRVATNVLDWPSNGRSRVGGVSSFGISGTNAHVLLEEAPSVDSGALTHVRSAELVVLSAKTPEALTAAAARLREHLEARPDMALADIAYSLLTTRSSMDHRLTLAVADRKGLGEALQAAAQGGRASPLTASRAMAPKVVFVFPGQGSQWVGMGRQLLAEEPAFSDAIAACDRAIQAETGWSVIEELETRDTPRFDRVDVVQPLLFAFQVALAALWRSWGIEPDAVVGHSMGEVAAAVVAEALSLEEGAAVICRRSRLLRTISGQGEMALAELSMEEARAALVGFEDRVGVAVSNSARSTVLSGEPSALGEVLAKLEGAGVFCRRVKVDVASHSPQVDPLLDELASLLGDLKPRAARVTMHSTVTGAALAGTELAARYWVSNLRQPVRFAGSVESLFKQGFRVFLELSPHPLLVTSVEQIRQDIGAEGVATGSLRREQPERLTLLESLGAMHVHGHRLDAARLFPSRGRRLELPTYAWQRRRYWTESAPPTKARAGTPMEHPLLGARLVAAGSDAVYESVLSSREPTWLAEHRVGGYVVVPAAAIVELIGAASEQYRGGVTAKISALSLRAPLILPAVGSRRLQIIISEQGTRVAIYSQADHAAAGAPWTLHASSEIAESPASPPGALDLSALRRRCSQALDVGRAYATFAAAGLVYGAAFQGLRALWAGPGEALAEIALDESLKAEGYAIHPALLDAALQAVVGVLEAESNGTLLPFELGRVVVYQAGFTKAFVHVRLARALSDGFASADLTLVDSTGEVLAEIDALGLRCADLSLLGQEDAPALPNAVYRLDWQRALAPVPARTLTGRWLVVALADPEQARAVSAALSAHGAQSEWAQLEALPRARAADHVLCVWEPQTSADAALLAAHRGLAIVQALAANEPAPRLWWVTRAAVAVSDEDVAPATAALWGLGRTLMHEHPALRCTLIDLEPQAPLLEALLGEVGAGDDESQVAWRGGHRHVARLVRAPSAPPVPSGDNYRLEARQAGTLDGLSLGPAPRRAPGPNEVEIEVHAAGLNFRDVLTALGMVNAGALGGECSGIITAVGAGVENLAVGDRVMALAQGTFGRFVSIDARLVVAAPASLSLRQAAAVPVAFLTAWYALHDLARLKPGERLLVHAAAGGVGMAAVQLAQALGAEVLATASPSKWDVVRALGVRHIASSRDLGFAEAFRSTSGADVVLNALTGDFIDASLSLLSAGGRFIEMGKVEIRAAASVAASYPGVVYRAFDLIEAGPDRIAEMLAAIKSGFDAGWLKPLPVRAFSLAEAESAFRFMAQARHVGKIVLLPRSGSFASERTVLITGGLGALGLQVARSLVRRGVKHLLLTGRRGLDTPGAAEAVTELRASGAEISVAAVDVADRDALRRALQQIPATHPLVGVVHAAGLLDDGLLVEQTPERFSNVFAPKVAGAWHLHELTRDLELDFFVLFSSLAGSVGSPSQGGYAAANAFLDALAAHRRAQGLAGLSLAWGPWAEGGLAAALDARLRARLARQGIGELTPSQGTALLSSAMQRSEAHLVLVPLDLRAAARALGAPVPPLWRSLLRAAPGSPASGDVTWARRLAALPPEQHLELITDEVRQEAARVLSLASISSVPRDRSLKELGLDSLMALELRNSLGRRAGSQLPVSLIFQNPTPVAIARHLLTHVLGSAESVARGAAGAPLAVSAATQPPTAAEGTMVGPAESAPGTSVARCECQQRVEAPMARLFCFHDAGGTSMTFAPFARLASAGIEVHTVAVSRPTPRSDGAARDYLESAARYIEALSDRPFVLLGHSLGALFALRLAEHLAAGHGPQPLLLVASAPPPPGEITLSESAISGMMSHFLGAKARESAALRDNFMADFSVCGGLPRGSLPLPRTPIAVFLGRDDPFVQAQSVELWRPLTALEFSITTLPGDHFYIHGEESRALLLDELTRAILAEVFASTHPHERTSSRLSRTTHLR